MIIVAHSSVSSSHSYKCPRMPSGCVQVYMSANSWGDVDYERVASVCMRTNKKHFEVRSRAHGIARAAISK